MAVRSIRKYTIVADESNEMNLKFKNLPQRAMDTPHRTMNVEEKRSEIYSKS